MPQQLPYKDTIVRYYDESEVAYRDVWHLDTCRALHYGFWDSGVGNLKEALIKENEVLSNLANITGADRVLDSGCGVGGSSIYLSQRYGCKVTGISLSAKQVAMAQQVAADLKLSEHPEFLTADFHDLPFPDEHFTVVWFVESFCHANDIRKVLSETYRVLKPGGRLIIADGFASKEAFAGEEKETMDKWLLNWAVPGLPSVDQAVSTMISVGFQEVICHDYTEKIRRSALRLNRFARLAMVYKRVRKLLGKPYGKPTTLANTLAARYQYRALKAKLWGYRVVSAVK